MTAAPAFPAAISGCGTCDGEWEPFCPSASVLNMFTPDALGPELGRELGRRGAPHSSQYCPLSRFEALHLSHVIMVFSEVCDSHPIRDRFSICTLELSSRTVGHSSAKVFDSPTPLIQEQTAGVVAIICWRPEQACRITGLRLDESAFARWQSENDGALFPASCACLLPLLNETVCAFLT